MHFISSGVCYKCDLIGRHRVFVRCFLSSRAFARRKIIIIIITHENAFALRIKWIHFFMRIIRDWESSIRPWVMGHPAYTSNLFFFKYFIDIFIYFFAKKKIISIIFFFLLVLVLVVRLSRSSAAIHFTHYHYYLCIAYQIFYVSRYYFIDINALCIWYDTKDPHELIFVCDDVQELKCIHFIRLSLRSPFP